MDKKKLLIICVLAVGIITIGGLCVYYFITRDAKNVPEEETSVVILETTDVTTEEKTEGSIETTKSSTSDIDDESSVTTEEVISDSTSENSIEADTTAEESLEVETEAISEEETPEDIVAAETSAEIVTTTVVPTMENTTMAQTIAPTTIAQTTVAMTTVASTTAAPMTEPPTTVAPTTETPKPAETTPPISVVETKVSEAVEETTISSFLTLPADGTYLRDVAEAFFAEQNKDRQSIGVNQLQWDEELYQMACNCAKAVAEAIANGAPIDNTLHEYSFKYAERKIVGLSGNEYVTNASENLAVRAYMIKVDLVESFIHGLRDSSGHYDRAMSDYFDQGATACYYYNGSVVSSTLFWSSNTYLYW